MIKIAGNKGIKTTPRICARCGKPFEATNKAQSACTKCKEIILRIWERNEELNKQYESESYEDMSKAFKRNLLLRLRG